MSDGRMTMEEWRKAIAEERQKEKPQEQRKPVRQRIAEAEAELKRRQEAKAGTSATAPEKSGADQHEVDILED